jgi:tetratricopeptide (TPR) repeat protein
LILENCMDALNSEQSHLGRIPSTSTVVLSPDENFEEFTLIWLDSDVNKTADCIDTKVKLKELIHFMVTFDDVGACLKYIRSIRTERILFIVSGKLGKVFLSDIQELPQILFIYIFCENKVEHEQWSKNHPNKLQGVFVDKNDLLLKLVLDLKAISMTLMPFSVFDLTTNESTIQDLNDDKVTFLWFQLLIEALLQIKFNNVNAKNEMIRECRLYYRNNRIEKERIYEFNSIYTTDSAIRWYTRDCFLYRLINKALRTQNIDIIFKFRFFIQDLYNQLKNEHKLQFGNIAIAPFSVYRGQLMSLSELDKLKNNADGYCSINTFLSTTTSCAVAVSFAGSGGGRPTLESVVFEIKINFNTDSNDDSLKPFASIGKLSYMSDENEVLFSIGTVFKIENVDQFTDDIWYVTLILSEQIDKNIQKIIDFYKRKLSENNKEATLSDLARFLVAMGDFNKAEKYYQILLDDLLTDNDFSNVNQQIEIGGIHTALGQIYHDKGNYDEAMKKYEHALSIVSPHSVTVSAHIYVDMGMIYKRRGDNDMALKLYEKALEISSDSPDTTILATIYNNIGAIY